MNVAPRAHARPLIAHVVHRFDVGGMENGVVNLINRMPATFADHCVIALTAAEPGFVRRIRRGGVRVVELHRPAGQTARIFPRLHRVLSDLRPAVFHTRNAGTLETQLVAWLARVPVRIHGEHGWDVGDLVGTNRRLLWLRRAMRHVVHHQIALSHATARYLVERVGVPADDVTDICNGVDTERFVPPADDAARAALRAALGVAPERFVIGAVGRLSAVKNLPLLIDAFELVRGRNADFAERARLLLVGEGPERAAIEARIAARGLASTVRLAGEQHDVLPWLQALDVLCLPSLAEGISNAILEAMACGLPVVASDVGGNPELVADDVTGVLAPSGDVRAFAAQIERYFADGARRDAHATAARRHATERFSLERMIGEYQRVYGAMLARRGLSSEASAPGCDARLGT